MGFSENLRVIRECEAQLSQQELAKRVGVSRPYISLLEQDKADPKLSVVMSLATALNVDVLELIEKPVVV